MQLIIRESSRTLCIDARSENNLIQGRLGRSRPDRFLAFLMRIYRNRIVTSMFFVLPVMLEKGFNVSVSIGVALAVTVACYFGMISILGKLGIKL